MKGVVASASGNRWWINLFCLIVSLEVCAIEPSKYLTPWHKIVFLLIPSLECSNMYINAFGDGTPYICIVFQKCHVSPIFYITLGMVETF